MTATWVLILYVWTGSGVSVATTPGFTKKACEWAAARAEYELPHGYATFKAICVKRTGDGKATKDE